MFEVDFAITKIEVVPSGLLEELEVAITLHEYQMERLGGFRAMSAATIHIPQKQAAEMGLVAGSIIRLTGERLHLVPAPSERPVATE